MFVHVAIASAAVIAMSLLWVTVDAAWKRTFPDEALRRDDHHGCGTCADKDSCSLPQKTP
jgi:hypothetical protein